MRIGVDVDGVLADFNAHFIERVIQVCGEDKFPPRPFDIPVWDYPKHYGYTTKQLTAVWEHIEQDLNYWRNLPKYHNTETALLALAQFEHKGNDLYYITSRPGQAAKEQTESWIQRHTRVQTAALPAPTVLLSSRKGAAAYALDLDAYIDDKLENLYDVHTDTPITTLFLQNRPWNITRETPVYVKRVDSVEEFLIAITQ